MNLLSVKKVLYTFQRRSLVLMYHNIAEPGNDPWELAVSPQNFREHLQVLKKYRVLPVTEFADAVVNRSVSSGSVALTFDDGYEDNFLHAAPLLKELSTPAMFFISTGYIGSNKMFWWDELAEILLSENELPENLEIDLGGEAFHFSLGDDAVVSSGKFLLQRSWKWHEPPPTKRCSLYFELWKRIRPLPRKAITQRMEFLYMWSGISQIDSRKHAMSEDQLLEIKKNSFIQTGIHTVSHPELSSHPRNIQRNELAECRDRLISAGMEASIVAFPYGDFNDNTIRVCRELGLTAAFTTSERMITSSTDPLRIGRFQVRNINGAEFEKQLKKWMTKSPS